MNYIICRLFHRSGWPMHNHFTCMDCGREHRIKAGLADYIIRSNRMKRLALEIVRKDQEVRHLERLYGSGQAQ